MGSKADEQRRELLLNSHAAAVRAESRPLTDRFYAVGTRALIAPMRARADDSHKAAPLPVRVLGVDNAGIEAR
ncbi:MAG: hypothetical protein AUH85_16395 [Chloroflexi bacterium 13_1_40CM_4_68_4]|nr:MAG: hypothetical protein AUH85_16395 [Chloroflexi bacterium 13_1_40CM_4_68_4]